MKRYYVGYDDELHESPFTDCDSDMVPASVAQALYDALVNLEHEYIQKVSDSNINWELVISARKALSLADGEK